MQKGNSKINTLLLILVVILLVGVIWIQWHSRRAEEGKDNYLQGQTQTRDNANGSDYQPQPNDDSMQIVWKLSPEFNLYYPGEWTYNGYSGAGGVSAFGITDGNAVISWGGNNTACSVENDYTSFQAGISTVACLKGMRAQIGLNNVRDSLSQNEIEIFGKFVLKNQ